MTPVIVKKNMQPSVLVVEDNKFSLSWVTNLLKSLKIDEIEIAENGEQAVQKYEEYA
jgi:CheY-like chemotaxis protein